MVNKKMEDYSYSTADPVYYGLLKEFAKEHKKHPTEAESIIWRFLKGNQLGKPFRRQHIIGDYIVDFICLPAKLIIEIDGGYHQIPKQIVSDVERTEWLTEKGFRVIRFSNEEVICNIDNVILQIKQQL